MHRRIAILEGLIALGALGGAAGLIATNGLGAPVAELAGSPFRSYLVPGLALALAVGGPMAAAAAANWRGAGAAPALTLLAGAALAIFEVVEALALGVRSALQVVFMLLAALLVIAAALELAADAARPAPPRFTGKLP